MTPSESDRLKRMATIASLAVAISLTLAKLVAAIASGSAAVLSSLVDSMADIAASAVTYLAVRIAQQPPDRRHRFGHGKAESLSALGLAALVTGSALFVLVEAARRLWDPQPLRAGWLAVAVMLLSILATAGLVLFQRYVIRRTHSQAIAADRLHYASDFLSNLAVLASLLLVERLGLLWLDPVVAVLVAGWLLKASWTIGRRAVDTLMDHELPAVDRARIEAIVRAHPEVASFHDLRTREAGGVRFLEFHIELDGEMTVRAAHRVTDALEHELKAAFPDSEIIIHQEPAGLVDERLDHRIQRVSGSRG
ncbi:MAG: cation diffusion facilitator family transporter [Geminicoccaceae bacterium]|nr:cation diffusion facilitator family transporter [Geminicoccaceae bacterium]MDW8370870.1 cation diffusion facilitator family transporter [Geminicoccaceae bacterium]